MTTVFLIVGSVLLVIMILCWVFCGHWTPNKEELRVTRTWAGIWIGGVFFLIFLPGLLAHLEIIPDKHLFWFPMLYVFFSIPTVGRYVREVAAVRKKRDGTEE